MFCFDYSFLLFHFFFFFTFISSSPWIWHFVWRSSLLIDSLWLFLPSVQYFYICLTSKCRGVNTFWSHNICSEQQLSNYFKQQKNKKKVFFPLPPSIHPSIHLPIITSHVNTPFVRSRDFFFCTFFNSPHYLLKVHALTGVYAADAVILLITRTAGLTPTTLYCITLLCFMFYCYY